MVQSKVNLDPRTIQIRNKVKAKYSFRTRSETLNFMVEEYAKKVLRLKL
ncbi:DUF2683 family protein [archaeon]|jgi:hypothetical protein|nr:DUF2683 family protein [archaeon]MBT4417152.1 DUF2683 family protein [archaeon]